jgi:hypothetical protein
VTIERPPGCAARCLGVVVGEDRGHVELHAGLAAEEVDGPGPFAQEGVDTRAVEMRARLVLQVAARGAGLLGDALLRGQVRARHPQPAARACGGAAELRLLVDHQHLQALVGGGDGRRHARGTGAHHQHVDFFRGVA